MTKKPVTLEDLAPILAKLDTHEARLFDHDALLGEHEERLLTLETPEPDLEAP